MLPYVVLGVAALLAWRNQSQEAQKPAVPVMNYKAVARNLLQQCRGAHAASIWR